MTMTTTQRPSARIRLAHLALRIVCLYHVPSEARVGVIHMSDDEFHMILRTYLDRTKLSLHSNREISL